MLKALGRHLKRLGRDTSGNALIMMAAGMPALIGGSGLAVDTAQWYLWQKELQYRADQGAIAGAWSLANGSTGADYQARALQEVEANQQVVDFDRNTQVSLADYAGGRNNSVRVTISASKYLPFSGFLTGSAATVHAAAQATFVEGGSYTACLVALNEEVEGAVTIGGNSIVTARCGIMAMSNNSQSITVPGNPDIDPGWVISAGGIDDWFNENTDAEIREYVSGLSDPFKDLTPPDNPTPQTYQCVGGQTTYTASKTVTVRVTYKTYSDHKRNPSTLVNERAGETVGPITTTGTVDKNTKSGTTETISTELGSVTSTTSGGNTIYTRTDVITTTTTTIGTITPTTTILSAQQNPGTYTDFTTSCDTTMAPGIYVIDGGNFTINAQYRVVGEGVMIVLKNGAGIRINGGAEVIMSAMNADQLVAAGVPSDQADKLAGMLVFEDRNSAGNKKVTGADANRINGNAATLLDGKVYLPVSPLIFEGTAKVRSQCLMLAANTITIMGNANMATFCPSGMSNEDIFAVTPGVVRLVE